ncbi:MAG: valine--tRNA ligase [Candidatus Caenarcaniphilales bacterium]|nr:valine--tRNA ligase [Candidatus Caenarcaniphilales bacterium]
MTELAKSYNPLEVEPKRIQDWDEKGLFKVDDSQEIEFSIAFPPPNVTGELHMGHALNSTLQDILIRYNRMLGKKVHWQIGCDHAGIGTQIVVEKQLAKENKTKYDLGREEFENLTWDWTKKHLGKIDNQMKLLGLSPDWSKSKFTLDEDYIQAVRKHFYVLFKQGLIRRGTRLINWCPHCLTSLSDLEVVHEERKGKLYEIKYQLVTPIGDLKELIVATSRPETLFGDVAVAINPDDEKYKPLIERINSGEPIHVGLPLTQKEIPVILSRSVETEFGTGALKVTPAHDFNDSQITQEWNSSEFVKRGKFPSLEEVNIFDEKAHILPLDFIPSEIHGLDRFQARDKTVNFLNEEQLLMGEKKYTQASALHDRCGNVIEPFLSPQWFVYMKPLASLAIDALKQEKVKFHPERYRKTYLDWLENIQDWCISRQIWWGHKIPVWSKNIQVDNLSSSEAEQAHLNLMNEIKKVSKECGYSLDVQGDKKRPSFLTAVKQGNEFIFERDSETVQIVILQEDKNLEENLLALGYEQETDVLDTWFSSALWPFATQGWPNKTQKNSNSKPWTSVLITAREIINLWVSRMIYSSVNLTGALPFKDILIHPVIQTPDGKRMSKSKGNAINPIDLIERYGADASRLWYCSVGIFSNQDARFPGKKEKDGNGNVIWTSQTIEDKRKFINKLWNATKFVIQNIKGNPSSNYFWKSHKKVSEIINRLAEHENTANLWILGLWNNTLKEANQHIKNYRFSEYVSCLENFFWYEFCDWYLELAKLSLSSTVEANSEILKLQTQQTLFYILEQILRSLNPIVPFATEELWQALTEEQGSLAFEIYPQAEDLSLSVDKVIKNKIDIAFNQIYGTKEIVQVIRSMRQKILGLPPTFPVECTEPEAISLNVNSLDTNSKSSASQIHPFLCEWRQIANCRELKSLDSVKKLINKTLEIQDGVLFDGTNKNTENTSSTYRISLKIPEEVNLDERKNVLSKELNKKQKDKQQGLARLNNPGFMNNASEEVKNELKTNVDFLNQEINELLDALTQIEDVTKLNKN